MSFCICTVAFLYQNLPFGGEKGFGEGEVCVVAYRGSLPLVE